MSQAAEIPREIEPNEDSQVTLDFAAMGEAIEAPDRGWFVVRNLFERRQIESYRRECERKFDEGPFFPDKFLVPGETADYVSPWIYDGATERHLNHRLYQFFHNAHSAETERIFRTVEHFRDRIEERWPDNRAYNDAMGLWPETIVTRYAPGSGRYPRHSDVPGGHTSPLLQCILLLSEPEVHYRGGDLVLYSASGRSWAIQRDLEVGIGDCLFIDRRLEHEVEMTEAVPGCDVGRMSALVCAMAPALARPTWRARTRRRMRPAEARLRALIRNALLR